ncbi:glycosyltransferase family 2 protein [Paenibacillus sp. FSL H8-0315]|uniref:tetratricopeptide repeat-containing glycosyltransferase family 2 protein n=1 Tax=Paenibacillus sp. FSL H8-0315 TaxID=2921384 RepID=UPI0030F68DB6
MLSLTMIVKNEAGKIQRCLESAKDYVDEIVVVDTGSTDNTKEIAISYGARVFDYKWNENFSDARNFALKQCKGDWSLILDADEYVVKASKDQISEFLENSNTIGKIRIINSFYQDDQVKESQAFVSRLIPRGLFFEGRIHEQIVSNLPRKTIPIDVYHDGYYKTDKSKRNIQLLELALLQVPDETYYLYQLGKEYRLLKDFTKAQEFFLKCYSMSTWRDGFRPQLVVECLYTIIGLKEFEKGLEIIESEISRLADFSDFHFVCGIFFMELVFNDTQKYMKYFSMIEKSYLKCLEIRDTTKYDSVLGTGSYLAAYNLALFYETSGDFKKAEEYYELSSNYNYRPAIIRMKELGLK